MKGYTAEDFKSPKAHMICTKDIYCADRANALLPGLVEAEINRRLEAAETVHQRNSEPYTGKDFPTGVWTAHRRASDTHKAKLLAITPIGDAFPWEGKKNV